MPNRADYVFAKPDERLLFRAMVDGLRLPRGSRPVPRDIGKHFGIHPKRVAYICEKWTRRRIYEYGVCVDLGWLRDE